MSELNSFFPLFPALAVIFLHDFPGNHAAAGGPGQPDRLFQLVCQALFGQIIPPLFRTQQPAGAVETGQGGGLQPKGLLEIGRASCRERVCLSV